MLLYLEILGVAQFSHWPTSPHPPLHVHDFVMYMLLRGGGPRVVVSTAAFHARVRGSVPFSAV